MAAVTRRLRRIGAIIKSITWDQGKELTDHAELERLIGAPVFFTDAHSPWQRGSNENAQRRNKALATKGDQPERAPSSAANHPATTQRPTNDCVYYREQLRRRPTLPRSNMHWELDSAPLKR